MQVGIDSEKTRSKREVRSLPKDLEPVEPVTLMRWIGSAPAPIHRTTELHLSVRALQNIPILYTVMGPIYGDIQVKRLYLSLFFLAVSILVNKLLDEL